MRWTFRPGYMAELAGGDGRAMSASELSGF